MCVKKACGIIDTLSRVMLYLHSHLLQTSTSAHMLMSMRIILGDISTEMKFGCGIKCTMLRALIRYRFQMCRIWIEESRSVCKCSRIDKL